jgi:AcrR family transcriptional regulator
VLRGAIELADEIGIEAITMRGLGRALGVEAMSLYNHVAGKDDLLEGVLGLLVDEIPRSEPSTDWQSAVRVQVFAARAVIRAHPWLPRLVVERSAASDAVLRYIDWVMGLLLEGGLPNQLIHDGIHVLGSRILGFAQDIFDPRDLVPRLGARMATVTPDRYPRLFQALEGVHHDDEEDFAFGLELTLAGLAGARPASDLGVPPASDLGVPPAAEL